jgi:hypothetical protein
MPVGEEVSTQKQTGRSMACMKLLCNMYRVPDRKSRERYPDPTRIVVAQSKVARFL